MLHRLDINNDGYVSMEEYISDSFGYNRQEIELLRKDDTTESQQILEVKSYPLIDMDSKFVKNEAIWAHWKLEIFIEISSVV